MRTVARALWLTLLVALTGGAALGQEAAPPPQGIKVHMHGPEPGYAADGYLFQPQGGGPFGAVLLIPDSRGIQDYVRLQGQALADAGMVAVVIDLFRGQPPEAGDSSEPNNIADLNAALNFLHSMPSVSPAKLGVAGWGSGASYALRLARSDSRIVAVSLAVPDTLQPADFSGTHAALLGIFGEQAKSQLQATATQRRARGCTADFYFDPKNQGRFYDPQDGSPSALEQAAHTRKQVEDFFTHALLIPR